MDLTNLQLTTFQEIGIALVIAGLLMIWRGFYLRKMAKREAKKSKESDNNFIEEVKEEIIPTEFKLLDDEPFRKGEVKYDTQ